jgi:hypothetical protein
MPLRVKSKIGSGEPAEVRPFVWLGQNRAGGSGFLSTVDIQTLTRSRRLCG